MGKDYRAMYGYDVGDYIQQKGSNRTAVVSRIDPNCDNVYVVAEFHRGDWVYPPTHEREITPNCWVLVERSGGSKVAPIGAAQAPPIGAAQAPPNDIVVTLYADRGARNLNMYHKRGKVFTLPAAGGVYAAKGAINALAANLPADSYVALISYPDGDVAEFAFTVAVEAPVEPPKTVEFT